jgi:hypothetical protein
MDDKDKTKEERMSELAELHQRNADPAILSPGEIRDQAEALGASQKLIETIFDASPT